MKNTLLVDLMLSLDNKERRMLTKVVRSPFFNRRAEVTKLYDYLDECLWQSNVIPSKEQAFRKLFGPEPYADNRMRVCMSYLLKLIEQALIQQSFFADETTVRTRLTQIYRQRQLYKQFERAYRSAESVLHSNPHHNAEYYEKSYQLQLEQYNYQASRKRVNALNLQEISNTLDIAYLSQKLRQTCYAISHQAVYNTEYDFGMLPELLKYVERKTLTAVPAIAVYYHCYFTLRGPDAAQHFASFKQLIFDYDGNFPDGEIRDLYLFAINFCLRDYNEGSKAYVTDLLDLYRNGLEKGYLLTEGQLSRFTYQNVVTLGLIVKEYDWVAYFLDTYTRKLEPAFRESMHSFCLARLAYSQKNYDHALGLLQQANYKDLLLNLSAKTVMLKIFFELNHFDLLEAHLEAMRAFLRRKKVMGYHKENYLNTIKMTRKILELPLFDKEGKEKLRQEVEAAKYIAEREWLLSQLSSA
ncbi:MAG: hypothetical protein AAF798_10165 [Bacteroidota bacterium]